jgi:predicted transcriptional regulator
MRFNRTKLAKAIGITPKPKIAKKAKISISYLYGLLSGAMTRPSKEVIERLYKTVSLN